MADNELENLRDEHRREWSHWLNAECEVLSQEQQTLVLAFLCGLVPEAVEEALVRRRHPTAWKRRGLTRRLFALPEHRSAQD